jgi:general secretion pathway protein B
LNLPAILLMQDNQGNKFNATLTGLDEQSATFAVGTETTAVSIDAFAQQWSGHYTLLWRMPPVTKKKLRPGDRGPDVLWLGKQLAQFQGKAPETAQDQVFDVAPCQTVSTCSWAYSGWFCRAANHDASEQYGGYDIAEIEPRAKGQAVMSYILEALKKSDQQRQRGATPTLQAVQITVAAPKRPLFIYGLLAMTLLSAGVLIGWLQPWQSEQIPVESVAAEPTILIAQQSAPQPLATPPAMFSSPAQELPAQTATSAGQAPMEIAMQPDSQLASSASSIVMSASEQPRANVTQEPEVMRLEELPFPIQQEIPPMAVQLHTYSNDPSARLVSVNSIRLREGGSLMMGLKLEQITPDGMIFSYKGYRFKHGIR